MRALESIYGRIATGSTKFDVFFKVFFHSFCSLLRLEDVWCRKRVVQSGELVEFDLQSSYLGWKGKSSEESNGELRYPRLFLEICIIYSICGADLLPLVFAWRCPNNTERELLKLASFDDFCHRQSLIRHFFKRVWWKVVLMWNWQIILQKIIHVINFIIVAMNSSHLTLRQEKKIFTI